MTAIPRSARAPLTAKQPEACPHCGGRSLTRRGTRKKKREIAQLWRCASCKRTFTPGPAALRNRTYPLRMILSALTDYDLGFTLEETAARLKKKTHRNVSPSTVASWLEQYKRHCSYRRLRAQGLSSLPATQTIKLYHRQVYSFAYPTKARFRSRRSARRQAQRRHALRAPCRFSRTRPHRLSARAFQWGRERQSPRLSGTSNVRRYHTRDRQYQGECGDRNRRAHHSCGRQ
jgi:transposase-like protein